MILAVTILLFLVAFVLTTVYKNWRHKARNLPPSPLILPIVGHLHLWTDPKQMVTTAMKYAKALGGIYSMKFGTKTIVFIGDPDLMSIALTKHRAVLSDRPSDGLIGLQTMVLPAPEAGIAFCDYTDSHKKYRALMKSFITTGDGFQRVNSIITSELYDVITQVKKCASTKTFVSGEDISTGLTFNMITGVLFNERGYNHVDKDLATLLPVFQVIIEAIAVPFLQDLLPYLAYFDKSRLNDLLGKTTARDEQLTRLLKKIRSSSDSTKPPRHYIDIILRERPSISDGELIVHIQELILGGYDTSANAIQITLALLAKNLDMQQKLRDAIGDIDAINVPIKDLQNIQYLRNVVQEVFRIAPIAPLYIAHKASDDFKIGGYTVPKDSIVYFLHQYECHNAGWENVFKFDPDRWDNPVPNKVLPFGRGPRQCPGERIATSLVYRAVASYIQNFEWTETNEPNSMELEFCSSHHLASKPKFCARDLLFEPKI